MRILYTKSGLVDLVDNSIIKDKRRYLTLGITTAVELSYLSKDVQKLVFYTIEYEDLTPSRARAIKIRKLTEKKKLDFDILEKILCEEKGNQHEKISFNKSMIISVLPFDLVKRDKRYIEQYIIEAIKSYKTTNK